MFDPDPNGSLALPAVVTWVADLGAKGKLPRCLGFVHPGDVADTLDVSAAQTARMVIRERLISGTLPFELIVYPSGYRMPAPGLASYFSSESGGTTMETGWLDMSAIGLYKDLHQARVIIVIKDVEAALGFRLAPMEQPATSQTPRSPKRRGPKAYKRDPTVDQMVEGYAGRASALDNELEKTLAAKYGVSRTTAREAKTIALSKLRQIPT
jgi:hypothetical protein